MFTANGQTVNVRYAGRQLRIAAPFDSSVIDVTLGAGRVVKGFEEGVSKLKKGEKATILFPSALGYGTQGVTSGNTYVITPYAPLRFDLEVIDIK